MEDTEIGRIADNEREWRMYMLRKIDKVETDLAAFKMRVMGVACLIGSASGISASFVKDFLI